MTQFSIDISGDIKDITIDINHIMKNILDLFFIEFPELKKCFYSTIYLSIRWCEKGEIKDVNAKYLNNDAITDIVSIGCYDNIITEEDRVMFLGEMFIDLDYMRNDYQTLNLSYSFINYIKLILIHGFLHLLGFDHQEESDERRMFALQEKFLKKMMQ